MPCFPFGRAQAVSVLNLENSSGMVKTQLEA